jgi:DNA-binding beta-propeller fold protein YncE
MAILSALRVGAQEDPTLDASKRRFPEVSAGFRTVRRGPDGTYYVLASPTPSNPSDRPKRATRSKRFDAPKPTPPVVLVFDSQGEKLRQIPAQNGRSELVSPSSLDIDASGRVYIADQGSNAVSIYAADGTLFVRLSIPAPTQIIALPGDQFAVCSANADQLIGVYDLHGALRREFGEPAELSDDPEVNHRLNTGHLAADEAGNLYFAFRYLPEPTVRKYDPTSGYLVDEMTLTTLDLQPMAQSARQEIARLTSGKAVLPHEIISAIGVDPETQELWLALGNLLMHFDNADRKTGSNRIYAIGGARLVPHFILVEKDDLLLGNDPLGIYEFARASNKVHGP